MRATFDTGGAYLRKIRLIYGCLTVPTIAGFLLLITAANDLEGTILAAGLLCVLGTILYSAITTSSDGQVRIDARGIWTEQTLNPITPGKKQVSKTLAAWDEIQTVSVGYGTKNKQTVAPNHVPVPVNKLSRKPSFMAHMSGTDWSLLIDIGQAKPIHMYAANMNDGRAVGTAIGLALWKRNLIAVSVEE